jgi:hypothetical protein
MSRKRSSAIARIRDIANSLIAEIDNAEKEHDLLEIAGERFKEIEPALNKLNAALNPAPGGELIPPAAEPVKPPVDPPVIRERHPRKKKDVQPDLQPTE